MNIQIELRKVIDAINAQPIVIRLILWFFAVAFVILPLAIPVAVVYLVKTAIKGRDEVK